MIQGLACSLGRKDEGPNIVLAEEICGNGDSGLVAELVAGLQQGRAVANDCIKVLYEVGERSPELIAPHVEAFLTHLLSPNNRMVWGCMTALASVTPLHPDAVFQQLERVKSAHENASVITRDQSISVLALLCKAKPVYAREVFPFLLEHLETCRPKEVAQHAERVSVCITEGNAETFLRALDGRMASLSDAQKTRLNKLCRTLRQ